MGGTIITFVSLFAQKLGTLEFDYPDRGSNPKITGILTNDAPVKYLLQTMRPSRVILLCSEEAKTIQRGQDNEQIATLLGGVQTAESHIKNVIRIFAESKNIPVPEIITIPYGDNMEVALNELLAQVDDGEVGLDITGGRRDYNILILLAMRALGCLGRKITQIVYSQLSNSSNSNNSIEKVNYFANLFDLINGMYEMQTFGRTDALKTALKAHRKSKAYKLTEEIGELIDRLSLCQIDYETLQTLLGNTRELYEKCSKYTGLHGEMDVLFKRLLKAFNQKILFLDKNCSLPMVLTWCVEHKMLQQALTIYNELMPDWLLSEGFIKIDEDGYVKAKKASNPNYTQYAYESLTRKIFVEYAHSAFKKIDPQTFVRRKSLYNVHLSRGNMEQNMLNMLVFDFKWVLELRNTINHSIEVSVKQEDLVHLQSAKFPISLAASDACAQITNTLTEVIIKHLTTLESTKK